MLAVRPRPRGLTVDRPGLRLVCSGASGEGNRDATRRSYAESEKRTPRRVIFFALPLVFFGICGTARKLSKIRIFCLTALHCLVRLGVVVQFFCTRQFYFFYLLDWAVDLMNLRLATSRVDSVVVQAGDIGRLGLQHHLLS